MTTQVTLSDAHRSLLALANNGREYRNDEVYHAHQLTTGTELDIVGSGFDLDRHVTVNLDGTATDAHVQLRVLAMRNGNLFVRTWLNWTSSFGDHRSYVGYDLSPEAIVKLGGKPITPDTNPEMLDGEGTIDFGDALDGLMDFMSEMDELGTHWDQQYPHDLEEITNEEIEYHGKFVLAARETEPMLLNMLSDSELGAAEAQEIIDLLTWLSQQPEVTALA
jgi:hypothetical protein